jgi:hypothetical protein
MQSNNRNIDFVGDAKNRNQSSSLDRLGFYVLISVGLSGATLLSAICLFFMYKGLADKPMPALVQLANGKTIKVATMSGNERTPQVIKDFASLTMVKMLTWNGTLPPETTEDLTNPKPDPGVDIPVEGGGGRMKVPTVAWRTSFSLSHDLQNPFLIELAKLTTSVMTIGSSTRLEILNIGEPIQIQPGAWRVPIVANLIVLEKSTNLPKRVEFNKDVFIHAVPVPPIIDGGKTGEKQLSELVAEGKAAGLEIYLITAQKSDEIKPVETNKAVETPKTPKQK